MKKHLQLLLIVFWLTVQSLGQSIAQNKPVNQQISSSKDVEEEVAKMDLSKITTGFLLNKGFLWADQIKPFTDPSLKVPRIFEDSYWRALHRGIVKSDIKDSKSFKTIDNELDAVQKKFTEDAIVPIGIINVTGNQLSNEEIRVNKDLKVQGKSAANVKYKEVQIFSAAALVNTVYNKRVSFVFDSRFVVADKTQDISDLVVDFGDDKGFQKIDWHPSKSSTVIVNYDGVGKKLITFKFNSKKAGTYVCYTTFTIAMDEIPIPYRVLDLTANKQVTTRSQNGRVADIGLAGGQAGIYLGCDGVFDKPIIIVEGFDGSNTADLNFFNTISKYGVNFGASSPFGILHQAGYDRVILNFNDGGDYIENNAQVLKELINRVNTLKTGNNPITVIGESMGGLVARVALTQMERAGQSHNVSRYISYDTPHLGANVPVGLQQLGIDIGNIDLVRLGNLFNISSSDLNEQINNAQRPAAKQLLRYHYQAADVSSHPLFTSFQSLLQSLGYPTQCKNIAVLHGSRSTNGQSFNPGSMLLQFDVGTALASAIVRTRSHNVGGQTRVNSLTAFFTAIPTTVKTRDVNTSNPNLDAIPGGESPGGAGATTRQLLSVGELFVRVIFNIGYSNAFAQQRICFVPSLSGVGYTGPLNSQNDWQASVDDAINRGQTSFSRENIYAPYGNSEHVVPTRISNVWAQLFYNEFDNLTYNNSCPQAPDASWSGSNRVCAGSTQEYTVGPFIGGFGQPTNFSYTWTLQPGGQSFFGNKITIPWNVPPGVYTLSCRATDLASPNNPVGSYSYPINVYDCNNNGSCSQRYLSVSYPNDNTTLTTSTFPFFFDVQTNTCDPQGISQIQYNIIDPNGTWFWAGYVDVPSNNFSSGYSLSAARWNSLVSSNNAYQITRPGRYIIQARLFSNGGSVTDAAPVHITIAQSGNPPPPSGDYNQCFEAEAALLSRPIYSDPNASGGQYAGAFGHFTENAQFSVNGIPSSGTYNLKIRYASGETPTAGVVINGNSGNPILVPLPTTQSWGGNYNEVTATIPLNQGNNTVRIQGAQQAFMLDKICVQGGGSGGGRLAAIEPGDDMGIQVFPNPTTSSVTIQYYVQHGQEATLSIVDLSGRETPMKRITGENRRHQEIIDVDKWPNGTYLIKVKTISQLLTKKLVVSH